MLLWNKTGSDEMKHNEYIKAVDGANTAVLMIHGIFGTPRHFDDIVDLVPQEWSVYNILLDGHGKGVKDFARTSMDKWKSQVDGVMAKLYEKYDNIYIIGHSMGTLLSLYISHKYADKIRAMILLAVPLKVFLKPVSAVNSLKLVFGLGKENNPLDVAARNTHSVSHDAWVWHYAGWIPRYLELFALIREVRNNIENITVPCYTFQSKKDEMVAFSSLKHLQKNKEFVNNVLENSMHFYYEPNDYEFLKNSISRILKKN